MGEISMFGSGEGLVWVTGRGYSTTLNLAVPCQNPSDPGLSASSAHGINPRSGLGVR